MTDESTLKRRGDYRPPAYTIPSARLDFQLDYERTVVTSTLSLKRQSSPDRQSEPGSTERGSAAPADLVLNGSGLELHELSLSGETLVEGDGFRFDGEDIVISAAKIPASPAFEIRLRNSNFPTGPQSSQLFGLYVADGVLCTQCEPNSFRKITYFVDRPDIMCEFEVRLEADATVFPTLLCNGNVIAEEKGLPNGRHSATFRDLAKSPNVFAIVAGKLASLTGGYIRGSHLSAERREKATGVLGEEIQIAVHASEETIQDGELILSHAKKSLQWHEETLGRTYDLRHLRYAALSAINFAAMENNSLIIMDSRLVLLNKDTGLDSGFVGAAATVSHELSHTFFGNGISIRDFFQVTLKEGLCSVLDASFQASQFGVTSARIDRVQSLKSVQFKEDASPNAHCIRPETFKEVANLYTATTYTKGAWVLGCCKTILGNEKFSEGLDLYYRRFLGQAITCDDFLQAMFDTAAQIDVEKSHVLLGEKPEDIEGGGKKVKGEKTASLDLSGFDAWYSQKGTPRLKVRYEFHPDSKILRIEMEQIPPRNASPTENRPFVIPVTVGLIGRRSRKDLLESLPSCDVPHSRVLLLRQPCETFFLRNVEEEPFLSVLRDFSAPIIVESVTPSSDDLAFQMAFDSDPVNVWTASQAIFQDEIIRRASALETGSVPDALTLPPSLERGIEKLLENQWGDNEFVAKCLRMPSRSALELAMSPADPLRIDAARASLTKAIGERFEAAFLDRFQALADTEGVRWEVNREAIGKRSLRNLCLDFLAATQKHMGRIADYVDNATCFNDIKCGSASFLEHSSPTSPSSNSSSNSTSDLTEELCARVSKRLEKACGIKPDMRYTYLAVMASQRCKTIEAMRAFVAENDKDFVSEIKSVSGTRQALQGLFGNTQVYHANDGSGYKFCAELIGRIDEKNSMVSSQMAKSLSSFSNYSTERQTLIKEALHTLMDKSGGISTQLREIAGAAISV